MSVWSSNGLLVSSLSLNFVLLMISINLYHSKREGKVYFDGKLEKLGTKTAKRDLAYPYWTDNFVSCDNKPFTTWNQKTFYTTGGKIQDNFPGCYVKEVLEWRDSLKTKEFHKYSQHGEDGITLEIFKKIGSGTKYFVEFGVQTSVECNSRILRDDYGWTGVQFDGTHLPDPTIPRYRHFMWLDTVVENFKTRNVRKHIDFLSVDTDFADFWMLNRIINEGYKARVVVVEYNSNYGPFASITVTLKDVKNHTMHDGTKYYQASVAALEKMMKKHDYSLVYMESSTVNLFFIHNSEFKGIDLASADWVRKLGDEGNLGTRSLHKVDNKNRHFSHICFNPNCNDSNDW